MTGVAPLSRSPDASGAQRLAARPDRSTWLSANAGSGKTRVLTDRVARLLLQGVNPQHVLCLTYTKAAASEMQNRLFRTLGTWAMLEDAALAAALADLGLAEGEAAKGAVSTDMLVRARRLFARAIETPGGLRIQTIHSFCASLLRRFPMEAGVSPGFSELDDRTARLLRDEIAEELAEGVGVGATSDLARTHTGEDFGALLEQIARNRAAFDPPLDPAGCRVLFGLSPETDAASVLAGVFLGDEANLLAQVLPVIAAGSTRDVEVAQRLAEIDLSSPDLGTLRQLEGIFLTKSGKTPFAAKLDSLPTKATAAALGPLKPRLDDLMRRVEAGRARRLALEAARRTAVLHRYAALFLPEYERRKSARGWLDFDDLIARAHRLLADPSVAAWVLYRLDGGIDHILVDEAQDTSPAQWAIIEALAAEFLSGQGARSDDRTIFVVGDKKQSIYSFQGADVAAFDRMRDQFGVRLAAVERPFQALELLFSFRSSPAILSVVDAVLAPVAAQALGGEVRHLAFKSVLPGRVDLWPMLDKAATAEDEAWFDPVDLVVDSHHAARLGKQVADAIAEMIAAGTQIATDSGPRAVMAGDVLVLVQRRGTIFAEVIRACKARGLPIAGADRLKLGGELAVRDLTALLAFLDTPEDDLSLAAVLRSPLFGWGEAALHALAQPRRGTLWQALRTSGDDTHAASRAMLHDLLDQADFLRPFELISRALIRHDGRRRLVARLGAEAEDGIDEMLNQALAYERLQVPSLTGFLVWLASDDVEVKRQADSAGDRIRVMTVHGAKGLEAPVVILPDTADRTPRDRDEIYRTEGGAAVWRTGADESPPLIAAHRAAREAATAAENLRLLYVAMTRAKCWLIVMGAGEARSEQAWHSLITAGMLRLGAVPREGGRLRHAEGIWPENVAPEGRASALPATAAALPAWAALAPPQPVVAAPAILPSGLGGAKALGGDGTGLDEAAAMERGHLLHLLLEVLPAAPSSDWPALARALIEDEGLRQSLLHEAEGVLGDAGLSWLFGPGTLAEVPLVADWQGRVLTGVVDRLVIGPDRVLAVDYKSNRTLPARPEDVPEGLLRQMGAYAHALAQIYPGRRIETAILWTSGPLLMPLHADIVRQALSRATIP